MQDILELHDRDGIMQKPPGLADFHGMHKM